MMNIQLPLGEHAMDAFEDALNHECDVSDDRNGQMSDAEALELVGIESLNSNDAFRQIFGDLL